ncbi:sodium:solute symporter family protein [Sinanaerobacter chloroacetimidivorans]|uniref:Sodium:solute symporter family protein n=1 Tax=Sinanaerobacter chloroacetimidivorans TaxID=2818044 RepID=A0A8J7W1V4_9FIRM|nr:sodium:solute symporter family protein [Sinanaerobacter chloroacetimidivorans]MBR0599352.1 sodium:solute symporter family protein [Sinanaerobacter chloroacetimidivorans]
MVTNAIVLMIVSVFAFVPLLLAEVARNKSLPTTLDFILQGRKLGLFSMYATVFSTWMSAFAFIGAITYFYEEGPIYMTTVGWDALFAVLFILVGKRLWFYGKTHNYMTPRDFFNDIYGSEALNLIVTIITIAGTMIYLQVQILAGFLILSVSTEGIISLHVSGIIFFAILVIYIWAGGLRAVALTDIFYGALIVVAIISSGIFLIYTAGGVKHTFDLLIESDPANVSIVGVDAGKRIGMWLALFILVPVGAFMGPQIWIRNYASASEKNFDVLPLLLYLSSIICIGTLFAGSAGTVLAGEVENPDSILVKLIREYAHPFFYTFIIVGIYAAIFSTANSQVHALSAVYTIDVHKRYINKNLSDRGLLLVAKWTVLLISVIAYILILLIPQNIFDLGIVALGGTAQLFIPVVGALFWKKSSSRGAVVGILAGEAIFFLSVALVEWDTSLSAIAGLLCNLLVFIAVGRCDTNYLVAAKIESYKNEYHSKCN